MDIYRKKIILGTALVTLLTFSPSYSFARVAGDSPTGPVDGDIGNIYIAGHYHGEFFNKIGGLKGKEDAQGVATGAILGWDAESKAAGKYKPKYKNPVFAGGASIGVALMEGIRIEFEGLYSQINVDDKDFESEEKAQYVELQRAGTASGNTAQNSNWASIDVTVRTSVNTGLGQNDVIIANPRFAAFKMKNEGFNNIAGMINAYGDFRISEEFEADLYAGVGAGLTKIKFLDTSRFAPAYQIKGGISCALPNSPAKVFVGYRYFGVFGDKFKEVKSTTGGEITAAVAGEDGGPNAAGGGRNEPIRIKSTTATIESSFAVHGIEAGIMYNF
ncbi:P44/Msp2 family outer membrane protein [Candidatus Mesenet endosymbiont of Agriotes lineatus]|uniref:P44/Msp2 family outer membrane protein n=1 Tax=Candidatus Mesenet endosymbiont of Agriotes lineatus TaxID=3077948 RepID=UPI0030CC9003